MLEMHKANYCIHSLRPWKYGSNSCSMKMVKKDMQLHKVGADETHLEVALEKLSLLLDQEMTLQEYGESFAFKVSGFSMLKKIIKDSTQIHSIPVRKMRVLVDCNGCNSSPHS